ncbi:MAG: hypothetical protein AAF845_10370 [Bacteroidota bacterium]
MTPSRILFFGLLAVGILLYVLNPGPETFKEFLQEEIAARAEAEAREAGEAIGGSIGRDVGGFLAGRLGREVGDIASDVFVREDYYLASVYTADLNDRGPGGAWRFLGIAGWFVPLEQPEL